ncbi:acyltransferase family protein [Chryseosolibacter indicus]|uniref:Acyltransferase family protein n=1 Tax=Chryseosolibacter indicus TaxID=2782351 RepID=A0ABS5VN80_9BACT|nr:acyltransferase family protein [Chryseosolibacter indicus]MBT1702915.1 acyltransferase family protein [Chryseosolibacter indicus]
MAPIGNSIERRYDLAWLRFIAIVILLFFHTGMLFNPWNWHIKNSETSNSFTYWMIWLHFWRMPLLLFISGAGTYMALGKRITAQFVKERFTRLFIPLAFGIFVIVPPQIYFEHISEYKNYTDFYPTIFRFIPYPQGSFSWHHLWFVAYLFVYSLISIPFLIFLRSEKSFRFRGIISKALSNPVAILFVPAIFILITQIILRPYFPEETHALLDDWGFFTFYFCFFLFGMLCYSNSLLWEAIGRHRNYLLVATILSLIPFYITYFHFREIITLPWDNNTVETIFDVTAIFVSWFCVITVIAFGQHYLNKPHPWLKHFNEGLYPFYILHQTLIIVIGYYVCQLPWSIGIKFWTVSLLTLLSCLLIYFALIRPFTLMRIFFGMKPLKKKESEPVHQALAN